MIYNVKWWPNAESSRADLLAPLEWRNVKEYTLSSERLLLTLGSGATVRLYNGASVVIEEIV